MLNRPLGNSSTTLRNEVQFGSLHIQGGGTLQVRSQGQGISLIGDYIRVDSGGRLELDKLELVTRELEIHDFGIISATGEVMEPFS